MVLEILTYRSFLTMIFGSLYQIKTLAIILKIGFDLCTSLIYISHNLNVNKTMLRLYVLLDFSQILYISLNMQNIEYHIPYCFFIVLISDSC